MNLATALSTRRTRSAAAIAALLLLAALALTACDAAHTERPTAEQCKSLLENDITQGAPAGMLVYDASRSRASGGLSAEAAASIRALSAAKGSLSVLLVDGEGAKPQWVLTDVALNVAGAGVDTAVHRTAVSRSVPCIEQALAAAAPAAPGTDIAEAMRAAAEHGAQAGVTTYVFDTDGFANAGALDIVGRVGDAPVPEVVSELIATGWNARFDGASVTISGVARAYGTVVASTHAQWLRALYEAVCAQTGAAECAVPVADQAVAAGGESERSGAPEDADIRLATSRMDATDAGSTIVVPGSLLFTPNSAELSADADAVLAPVAQCVRAGARVSVGGYSAYDAAAPAGWAQELSTQRAKAAEVRVLALAGGAGDVSSVGFGDTQPVAGGSPADNRRVEFVIDGGC